MNFKQMEKRFYQLVARAEAHLNAARASRLAGDLKMRSRCLALGERALDKSKSLINQMYPEHACKNGGAR